MDDRKEVAFLLGAGAVKEAGLPTAVDLQEIVEKDITDKFPSLLPALRFISGAIQFGKACRAEPATSKVNIEDLLIACAFLASRNKSHIYPFVSAWHERISLLQPLPREIKSDQASDTFQFLGYYCKNGLRDWLAIKEPHRLKYLRSFKDFIDAGYRLRIFTLNYDECIECALQDILGPINGKWTTGFDEQGWKPELLACDDFDAYIYKLHGSLDWVNDPKFRICSVKWPPGQDSEEIPSDFEPLLIFGTNTKLQSVDPYLTLLFHFQQTLNVSDVLVVVGYSFADAHINAMLLEALQRDPQMRCLVAHKNSTPKDLLPPDFEKMVGLEERFIHAKCFAEEAFQSNELLKKVQEVFIAYKEELPF
ncbi:MAG: SIR2 family protein [Chloroflexi bacterium]|nr:SIR2 family protein [Chloroflexota bacterium]